MRVACLVSGGKDSIGAAYVAAQAGWTLDAFVTLLPDADSPMLFHRPNAKWVEQQAEAVGVPWRTRRVRAEEPEEEALRDVLANAKVDAVVVGALASEYQRTRFERVCASLGLKTFAPFWHHDPQRHLADLDAMGVRSVLVHVAANGLGADWLGRELDQTAAAELGRLHTKTRLNVAGEGGEYETFAVDAPFFRHGLQITASHVERARDHATLTITALQQVPRRRKD